MHFFQNRHFGTCINCPLKTHCKEGQRTLTSQHVALSEIFIPNKINCYNRLCQALSDVNDTKALLRHITIYLSYYQEKIGGNKSC